MKPFKKNVPSMTFEVKHKITKMCVLIMLEFIQKDQILNKKIYIRKSRFLNKKMTFVNLHVS